MTNNTDWLATLNATLDALDHAAASKGDTAAALASASQTLSQLEDELPTLPEEEVARIRPQLQHINTRLATVSAALEKSRNATGETLKNQRARNAAHKSYSGAPK